jgi:hypothetical protein
LVRTAAHGSSSALSALKASGYVPPPAKPDAGAAVSMAPADASSLGAEEKMEAAAVSNGVDDPAIKLIAFMKMPSKRHQSTQNLRFLKEVLHVNKDHAEEDSDSAPTTASVHLASQHPLDQFITPSTAEIQMPPITSGSRGPSSDYHPSSQHSVIRDPGGTKALRQSVEQRVMLPGSKSTSFRFRTTSSFLLPRFFPMTESMDMFHDLSGHNLLCRLLPLFVSEATILTTQCDCSSSIVVLPSRLFRDGRASRNFFAPEDAGTHGLGPGSSY